jgi:hypothetical protein
VSLYNISQVTAKANNFPQTRSRRLSACTKLMTLCSPFYGIKPSQCLVFSVCPTYYHLYPCFLYYILIFKIIPHPITLLIAFPLQVIIPYLILYHLLSLTYCCITYPLSSSHILSPHVYLTCRLDPFSEYKRCTTFI